MSAAMKTLIEEGALGSEAGQQIFCKKINDLLDIMNFNSILSAIEYKRALAKNSVSVSYLREMLIWIENLKTLNSKEKIITKKFKCLEG